MRVKLDGLKLYPGISASDYINNFMNLSNEINKIDGEAYSDNHYKFLFLKNIEHPDYQVTKKLIKSVRDNGLQEYITAIRKQERELLTEKFEVKKRKLAQLRRKSDFFTNEENNTHLHKIRKLSGEIATTQHGYIHLEAAAWKELDIEEKKLIQKYNARVKHNENYKDVKFPEGVSVLHKVRRTQEDDNCEETGSTDKQEPPAKKVKKDTKDKGIKFNLKESYDD